MGGHLRFDSIPKLPHDWWDGDDADTVWPTWGEHTSYFWGANAGNQFLDRGVALNGGGLASVKWGPTRGRAHPHYIGIDTMSDSAFSLTNNAKVYAQGAAILDAGHDLVVPVFMKHGDIDHGKFSLGTGYGLRGDYVAKIHAEMWAGIIALIGDAETVTFNPIMWTPDVAQPTEALRKANRVALPDLAAMQDYQATLAEVAAAAESG